MRFGCPNPALQRVLVPNVDLVAARALPFVGPHQPALEGIVAVVNKCMALKNPTQGVTRRAIAIPAPVLLSNDREQIRGRKHLASTSENFSLEPLHIEFDYKGASSDILQIGIQALYFNL